MNNYLELTATDTDLDCKITVSPVGCPDIVVKISNSVLYQGTLDQTKTLISSLNLMEPFDIVLELRNKVYSLDYETAAIVTITVDDIELIPRYNHLTRYNNDQNLSLCSNYIGFNGQWSLTIHCAFYHWLHQAQSQGWLVKR